jgi:alkaline phosphatase D
LASREEFQRLRAAVPTIATWDDHDYGLNDAGGDFSAKELAERIFETFWGTSERTGAYPGVYDAYVFGPEGRRVQILLLDTRFDRTELSREGRAYVPSTDPNQRMLSDAQWAWLADRLREPAELRIIASSIQILADGHRFEAWQTMPLEQQRLYRTIGESGAQGVVFVSGDRHIGGLYRDEGLIGYPAYELTTSSLNLSFRQTSDERSNTQMGDMYAPVNYGAMRIDWEGRTLTMEVRDAEGAAVRSQTIAFDEIGAG